MWHGNCIYWYEGRKNDGLRSEKVAFLVSNRARSTENVMASEPPTQRMLITLVSDVCYRVAYLAAGLRQAGVEAELRLKRPNHQTVASLRRLELSAHRPELVFIDYTTDTLLSRRMLKTIALCEKRSPAIVIVLTRPDTEALLEAGDLDVGDSTMFSATPLEAMLKKLGGEQRDTVLHSLEVLNRYGPVLARAPDEFVAAGATQESA